LCAAFFDRPGYPAARCTFRPAFTAHELEEQLRAGSSALPSELSWEAFRDRYDQEHAVGLARKTQKKIDCVCAAIESAFNPSRLSDVTDARISAMVAGWRSRGLKEATIKSNLATLRAMLRWAVGMKLLRACPTLPATPRAKKSGNSSPMKGRAITTEEFERLLAAVPKVVGEDHAPAWRHYLTGMWLSGLRLGESLEVYWDREDKMMPVLPAPGKGRPVLRVLAELEKGHSDRLLPIDPKFAIWLASTPEAERTGPVFKLPRRRGDAETLSETWVGRTVSKIGEAAGVIVRVDPTTKAVKFASAHDLRRSFGARWAQKVMPADLQTLMRHESIETTLRYYVGASAERTADACWDMLPGAEAEYAKAFFGREVTETGNTVRI
jgi:integrase